MSENEERRPQADRDSGVGADHVRDPDLPFVAELPPLDEEAGSQEDLDLEEEDVDDPVPIMPAGDPPAAAAPNAISGAQLNLVPSFTGEATEDVENWIMAFEGLMEAFTWTGVKAARIAEAKMTGKAAKWLRGQRSLGVTYANWNEVKRAMLARFKQVTSEVAATLAIHDLRQGQKETVDEFYDRVVLALDQKNHRVTEATKGTAEWRDQVQTDLYTFFGAGLRKAIRDATVSSSSPPTTAANLLKAARYVETSFRARESQVAEMYRGADVMVQSRGRGRGRGAGGRGRPTAGRPGGWSNNGGGAEQQTNVCYRCGIPGHFRRECVVDLSKKRGRGGRGRGFTRGNPSRGTAAANRIYIPAGYDDEDEPNPEQEWWDAEETTALARLPGTVTVESAAPSMAGN